MASADRPGFHASRPNAYQLACPKSWPVQFVIPARVRHARDRRPPVAVQRAVDDLRDERAGAGGVRVRVEELLPHRRQVHEVGRLAEVLLRDLQLGHQRRPRHRAEERAERLARLEVERAVLHLHDDVVAEAAVERHELQVGALDAIGIDLRRVDERAPHDDAAVRRDGVGQHVGAVGVRPLVVLRPRLPLAVRLDQESAEVRDEPVDLVGLLAPPPRHRRVERIGRGQAADRARRGEVGREVHADPVRPEHAAPARPPSRGTAPLSDCGFAFTLLSTVPLMPIEAFARAYSSTRGSSHARQFGPGPQRAARRSRARCSRPGCPSGSGAAAPSAGRSTMSSAAIGCPVWTRRRK